MADVPYHIDEELPPFRPLEVIYQVDEEADPVTTLIGIYQVRICRALICVTVHSYPREEMLTPSSTKGPVPA